MTKKNKDRSVLVSSEVGFQCIGLSRRRFAAGSPIWRTSRSSSRCLLPRASTPRRSRTFPFGLRCSGTWTVCSARSWRRRKGAGDSGHPAHRKGQYEAPDPFSSLFKSVPCFPMQRSGANTASTPVARELTFSLIHQAVLRDQPGGRVLA